MTSRRAICVSRDRNLRVAVEPALVSAGVVVEHCDDVPGDTRGVVLVVIDRATRQAAGDGLGAIAAPVVIVGDDLDDDGVIAAMLDAPVSHLVTDPSDRDLGITSAKLASGDLFGLEKYLDLGPGLGGAVAERTVTGDPDKRAAI